MPNQIDNSLNVFSRRSSPVPLAVLSSVVLICLFIGLATAFLSSNWALVAIFVLSIGCLAAFMYLNSMQIRQSSVSKDERRIDWQSAMPDIQRQNLNLEVFELAKILEVEPGQMSDLQSAYIVAEDLALRQIQQEENVPLMRHVSLGKSPFDAVLVKGDLIICIEVSFLVAPDIRQEKIESMLRKISQTKTVFEQMKIDMRLQLMILLITQLTPEDEDHLRSVINKRRIEGSPVSVEFRFLDFEALQRIYVTD